MAQVFGIDRQPTQLDYASPTQFKFSIVQLPKVEFFCTSVNIPGAINILLNNWFWSNWTICFKTRL